MRRRTTASPVILNRNYIGKMVPFTFGRKEHGSNFLVGDTGLTFWHVG